VNGTGWEPGLAVTVRYTGTLTESTASATPHRDGNFTVQLTARGTLPGDYTVSAGNGVQSDSKSFQQTS
jgi:hypothetical protein